MAKPKRKKSVEETIRFDPRLSQDKKTFVLVTECSTPSTWFEYLNFVKGWALQELDVLDLPEDVARH
jgi:hypothetical protein